MIYDFQVLGSYQSVREVKKPTNDAAYSRSISAGGM